MSRKDIVIMEVPYQVHLKFEEYESNRCGLWSNRCRTGDNLFKRYQVSVVDDNKNAFNNLPRNLKAVSWKEMP
jgi:hypothetical protein